MRRLVRIEPPWDQRAARALASPLSRFSLSPNTITTLSLVAGLAAAGLFAAGGGSAALGALLAMGAFWLDHLDGELARLSGRTSLFGHYYDLAADGIVLVALFVGIGFGLAQGALGPPALGLGVVAGAGAAAVIVLRLDLERRLGKAATRQPSLFGFEAEDAMYLVGPVTWLGALDVFLMLAALGTPLFALYTLWTSLQAGRRLEQRR